MIRNLSISVAIIGIFSAITPSFANTRAPGFWIEGPVQAEILRVIDGDTVEVRAFPWPQQAVTVKVRLRGIDAPEIHSRCEAERRRGNSARRALEGILSGIRMVSLTNVSGGKYFGRVLADLADEDGHDSASQLLAAGLVRAYSGGRRNKPADCAVK